MSEEHDQSRGARRTRRNRPNPKRSAQARQRNEPQQEGAGGSRRRRRNRRGGTGGSGGGGSTSGGGGGQQAQQRAPQSSHNHSRASQPQHQHQAPYKHKTPPEKLGGRDPINPDLNTAPEGPLELDAFELFCCYHLGITSRNTYERPNARDVARRFNVSIDEMHDALRRFGIDNDALKGCDFDISLARLDIKVAPEGIDRREIAKMLFNEMLEVNDEARELCQSVS